MNYSRHIMQSLPGKGVIAACVVAVLLSGDNALAQVGGGAGTMQAGYGNLRSAEELFGLARGTEIAAVVSHEPRTLEEVTTVPRQSIRGSLATLAYGARVVADRKAPPGFQTASGGRQRSTGRKVLGGALGAVGGFFGGGYLGAAIEGDRCDCDDPGLMGALIGAPIGAVIGAIVGAKFF
jgi:hypothetical protein